MNVISIDGKLTPIEEELKRLHRPSQQDIQNDFSYQQAKKISRRMLEKGLITETEYRKLMKLNRESFPPLLGALEPDD